MPERVIDAGQFATLVDADLRRDLQTLERVAYDVALWGVAEAVDRTNRQELVNLGHYKAGWKARQIPGGAELRNDVPYAGVIEHGRRPGRPGPPYQPIKDWVDRKLVANGKIEPKEAEGIAWAIRATLHKKGSPPHHILKGTADAMAKRFRVQALKVLRRQGQAAG